ncbi:MAG: hypothetical protein AAFZ11_04270 [Pseudomonadota bacterium]
MPGLITLPVACVAMACGSFTQDAGMVELQAELDAARAEMLAAQAEMRAAQAEVEGAQIVVQASTGDVVFDPTPAKMVEFDGGFDFLSTSRKLRIWRSSVQFDMKVDATGHATDCEVVDRFRKNYINMKLCEVVMDHYTFEPARDERNQPVEGSYRASLSYADLRAELD